jgi:hypothetical protein
MWANRKNPRTPCIIVVLGVDRRVRSRHDRFMAKTTIVQITDDLDGSADAQEVTSSFQGIGYTIDLGKKNVTALEKALKPYIDAATKTTSGSKRTPKKSVVKSAGARRSVRSTSTGQETQAIRDWAKAQGMDVSDRGRIPRAVLDQYKQAHNS